MHTYMQLHHVAERREVKGRSASFEELAEEQKQQRKSKKLEKLWADAGLQQMSSSRSVGRASPSRYHSLHVLIPGAAQNQRLVVGMFV